MISLSNNGNTEELLYAFQDFLRNQIKRGRLDHFTDEQMDLIENNILPLSLIHI